MSKRVTNALIAFVLVTLVSSYFGYKVGKGIALRDNAQKSAAKGKATN